MSNTQIKKLTNEELTQARNEFQNDWILSADAKILSHKFTFKGFYKTMGFVNAVAWIAQQEMHHPDLEVSYNSCLVKFTTHDADGLTENDIKTIMRVEALRP